MSAEGTGTRFGEALIGHTDEIVQRWYDRWARSTQYRAGISEAALKDSLPDQLRFIGEQIHHLRSAEDPEKMWKLVERLDPEKRVEQGVPIEELVQEFRIAVETVREWIEEHHIDTTFAEYSYFYAAMFELTAESVRRYSRRQAELVLWNRAEYLAGVMHQLRTPLAAISAQVQLLSRTGRAPSQGGLDRLKRGVQTLDKAVSGILRVERFRPSEQPLAPVEVQVAELIAEIMNDHRSDVAPGVTFTATVPPTTRMVVDRELLTDAIDNLVRNAVKHTRAGAISVEVEERSERVLFRVRDSGAGIAPAQKATLFRDVQPGSGGGSGLGLRIAQHAVLAQGGTIGVESDPGAGSVFWFELPRTVAPR